MYVSSEIRFRFNRGDNSTREGLLRWVTDTLLSKKVRPTTLVFDKDRDTLGALNKPSDKRLSKKGFDTQSSKKCMYTSSQESIFQVLSEEG